MYSASPGCAIVSPWLNICVHLKGLRYYTSEHMGRSRSQVRSHINWKRKDPSRRSKDINFFAKQNPGCGNNIYIKTSSATPYINLIKVDFNLEEKTWQIFNFFFAQNKPQNLQNWQILYLRTVFFHYKSAQNSKYKRKKW